MSAGRCTRARAHGPPAACEAAEVAKREARRQETLLPAADAMEHAWHMPEKRRRKRKSGGRRNSRRLPLVSPRVVDVPVILNDEFHQAKRFEFLVPQTQFLRLQRQPVAMVLSAKKNHTSRGQRKDSTTEGRASCTARPSSGSPALPPRPPLSLHLSWSSSSCAKKSLAGTSQHLCLRSLAGRHGYSGTQWSRLSRPSCLCRYSISMSCTAVGGPVGGRPQVLRHDYAWCCRAGYRSAQDLRRSAQSSASRNWRNSWWKCRLSCLLPFSSSILSSRPLTFQFPVLVLRPRGDLQGFQTGFHSASGRSAGAFSREVRTLSPVQKSARVAGQSSAELGAHSSSSTLSAHLSTWIDDTGDAWTVVSRPHSPYWLNLRTLRSQWQPPWER